MKKRLEAELISIAHRILKLKNKSETDQLYKESKKLYETLTVLKFYQDNYEAIKTAVPQGDFEEKLTQQFESEETDEATVMATVAGTVKEGLAEPLMEVISEPELAPAVTEEEAAEDEVLEVQDESYEDNDLVAATDLEDHEEDTVAEMPEEVAFTPIFELETEEIEEEEEKDAAPEFEKKQITIDTLLGENYADPVFVKPHEVSLFSAAVIEEPKETTLNDVLSKSIAIGLNDRIGFVQHLFGGSNEDFNRVLSQLNSFDTNEEAINFIEDMVKPDYNNWEGEEDYEERFMEIVTKKFN